MGGEVRIGIHGLSTGVCLGVWECLVFERTFFVDCHENCDHWMTLSGDYLGPRQPNPFFLLVSAGEMIPP